ncbi:hypothetical protein CTM_26282 [Clostridium tetanomorphum DSM 665]|nr:hypothetical protein CTM_26282 [Clostridium tetanomorphum DSM 665]
MKKLKYILLAITTVCFISVQSVLAFAASSDWTDKPEFNNYRIGQRLILKVRDAFLNSTEQEIFQFKYEGKQYENINGRNPVLVSNKEAMSKKQILIEAMKKHNELEAHIAEIEGRNPLLKDLNSIKEENYIIAVSNSEIASFDENEILKIKGKGTIYITIQEKETNKVYIFFMETAEGVKRIAGMNRVDTALKIAETTFKGKVRNVVLTTGENYPDALAGSVLAYKLEAPILLIGSSNVDTEKVLFYIKEKMESSGNVYILGGKGVVSEEIEQKVKDTGIKNVKRLSGATRYETAAQIVANLGVQEGTPVVIACGENFADALSVSITAAVNQYPILLAEKNGISDTVKKELSKIKPKKVFIIGLQGAISEEVENQISKELTINKSNIVRIGGSNRYDT